MVDNWVIDVVKIKKPLNNDELIVVLEGIEEDAILTKALDEYDKGESSNEMFHAPYCEQLPSIVAICCYFLHIRFLPNYT